jgi:hypothetical protein
MNALERAETQSGEHGYDQVDPHAPGGDSNNQLAREPSSYDAEVVPTPRGLEGQNLDPPNGQLETCQNSHPQGEPAANPGEVGEIVPPPGDATLPADVLTDEHGGALDPLPTVADKINALFDKAAKADEKAESYRISAGLELARARARVDAGEVGQITWTAWCADNIKRSEGDIRKVLAIASAADPAKAAAVERQRNREAIAKHRAYVSAVPGHCAVGAKKGVAAVAEPIPVTIDTVKRDIRLLSTAERSVLADWLIDIVAADERGEKVEPSPATTQAVANREETAETPLVSDAPAASVVASPPPQPIALSLEAIPEAIEPVDPEADSTIPAALPAELSDNDGAPDVPAVSASGEEKASASDPESTQPGGDERPVIRQIEETNQIPAVSPGSSASMPETSDGGGADGVTEQRPETPVIGEAVDPEAASTPPAAAPAEASRDVDAPEVPAVSPDGEEQPSASDSEPMQPGADDLSMSGQIGERKQVTAAPAGASAAMPEAFDRHGAAEVPERRRPTVARSTPAVSSPSNDSIRGESWVGRGPPDGTCYAPHGVCRYDSCAASGHCVSARGQAAA